MNRNHIAAAAVLVLCFCVLGFSQGNAQLGGIVSDSSKALIPGVTITVTNTETGVVATNITNDSGAYNFPSLQPGTAYKVTASLSGFQTKTVTNLDLGTSTNVRQDFQLGVAQAASTVVEIVSQADTLNTSATASVGDVLAAEQVRDLPLVGNNVLDLLKVLPGYRYSQFNTPGFGIYDVLGGQTLNTVNVTRDGLSVTDGRYSAELYGLSTTTNINPELVGEIRLILAPVDAELGRGNSQIQIQTRGGTNKYTGSAVWNIQNTALNANTWANNKRIVAGKWSPAPLDWRNAHDYTLTYGGPILKNKTFFFASWDQQISNTRTLQNPTVYTDTARQGIFRYWEQYNPGNAASQPPTTFGGATLTQGFWPSVDFSGNPRKPDFNSALDSSGNTVSYNGRLMCFSVFGNIKADGSPFTQADCGSPLAFAVTNPTGWDPLRPLPDSTQYIAKVLGAMPHANNFASGDGLNTAGYQYVRGTKGQGGGNAAVGVSPLVNRKQINLKIDQNFNASHKISVGYTYQRDDSADFVAAWPGGINGATQRRPQVLTATATSTLSASMLNEARFGIRREVTGEYLARESTDASIRDAANSWYLTGGTNAESGKAYPVAFTPAGVGNGIISIGSQGLGNITPLYNYADTFSWSHGKHAMKVGGELRFTGSNGYNGIFSGAGATMPTVAGGASTGLASVLASTVNTGIFTQLTNFLSAAPAGSTTGRANAANLLYFMNGSVASASMGRWIDDSSDVTKGHWEDITTKGQKYRDQLANEWSLFVKDDWKLTKNLTLNLGVRYDYYGSPYIGSGFTTTTKDQGAGLFGIGRGSTNNLFDRWLTPGNTFLTGYGSNVTAANALTCANGVSSQSPLIPVSNCDPNLMTQIEFVGPNTPNPNKVVIPVDKNNFGPAIGFAWQLPWLGEGKTVVRGGYQVTYAGAGRNGQGLDALLGGAPGATNSSTTNVADPNIAAVLATRALNLTDLSLLVPVTASSLPGAAIPIYGHAANFEAYDPSFRTPYTENITLQITRSMGKRLTLDARYVGTFGRKMEGTQNLNQPIVFDNPELLKALDDTRAGLDSPLFDLMFAGLDVHGVSGTGYGAVGTCVANPGKPGDGKDGCPVGQVFQHGSAQLRNNATFTSNLANGNYVGVISSLANSSTVTSGLQALPTGLTGVSARILRNGCDRLANGRYDPALPASATNIPTRCFSEDYFYPNPQFNNAFFTIPGFHGNFAHNNYHSGQLQVTARPTQGTTVQASYTLAKLLTDRYTTYVDPRNRDADYSIDYASIKHTILMTGTVELPIGPNKLFFPNATGWVARALERWQTSFIYNWGSGAPRDTFTGGFGGNGQHLYAAGGGNQPQARPDIVGPWENPQTDYQWNGPNHDSGTIYGFPSPYVTFKDPQCLKSVAATDSMGFNLQSNCTLNGLALVAPAGTPGAIDLGSGVFGIPVLQNPAPGHQGTQGARMLTLPGRWALDGNVSKTFRFSESKSLQFRFDATNILNHANPGEPTFDVMSANFGRVTADKASNSRAFQAQLRIGF